jgi:CxxC motif-containing protein (DUF1111 family)
MSGMLWSRRGALVLGLLTASYWMQTGVAQEPRAVDPVLEDQVREGQELFERDWKKLGALQRGSDGLGPVFNDVSCAACHKLGGVGGAGPKEKNVDLLSVAPPKADASAKRRNLLRENATKLHPGFKDGASLILHHFATDDHYSQWRREMLEKLALPRATQGKPIPHLGILSIKHTQRSTPALFGAGLIDTIPDAALIEVAERQAEQDIGISGRVPQTSQGAVGRFGWRGQTAHLREFVLTACAVELGLAVPGHEQAKDPRNLKYKAPALDLSASQCEALVAYVAHLPAPQRAEHSHLQQSLDVHKGRKVFETIGCADCHLPRLGEIDGIYSDLLLHDMGPELGDPVAAAPEMIFSGGSFSSGYFGGSSFEVNVAKTTTNVQQEWRTPPLWGVADSPPYLHDGRAATLDAAIRRHGGEGREAAEHYAALSSTEHSQLHRFLESLVAPGGKARRAGGGFAGF